MRGSASINTRTKKKQSVFRLISSFVREPLYRLLSAYKDKFIGNHLGVSRFYRNKIVKSYRPSDYYNASVKNLVSFPEFIKYFSSNIYRDQHWRQYTKSSAIHASSTTISLVTLEEDAPLLLKMAGIDDRVTFPPVHKSTSSSEVLEYYSQVPSEYITRIG